MKILVSGTRRATHVHRQGISDAILTGLVGARGPYTLVHGAAPGVDRLAADWARQQGWVVESHPAAWDRSGKAAGPRRNAELVAAGADLVLAFPARGPEWASRGTWDLISKAAAAGMQVRIYPLEVDRG